MTTKVKPTVTNVGGGRAIIMTPTADGNLDLTLRSRNHGLFRIGRIIDPNEEVPALELAGPTPLAAVASILDILARRRKAK